MKRVSVIIPAYNADNFIAESVTSALNQTYPDVEIIVVNDGSTDNTEKSLAPFMDLIIYIKKENGGPASARNIAIKRSTGEYICFLDADDIFLPHKLERQVNFMEKNSECGLVFADASIIGGKEAIRRDSLLGGLPVYQGHVFRHLFINNFIITLTVMIRREVLDKCGLLTSRSQYVRIMSSGFELPWTIRYII